MRYRIWPLVLLLPAACSSGPPGSAKLILNNPSWDRVNAQIVITRSADCDQRGEGFISTREFVMRKDKSEAIEVPKGASVCWRHDRNPNSPVSGAWTGWSRATLLPGQDTETEL